jgi:hypothetical protein
MGRRKHKTGENMRTTKFGVAVLAALATMIVGVAGAQAVNFTSAKYPAFIVAEPVSVNTPVFGFENNTQTAKCESAGFGGEMTKASSELKLSPGFEGCTTFGAAGTIEPNGCEFVLHPGTGSVDKFSGTFDVTCPAGKKIVIKGNTCEVTIAAQTGKGPIAYERITAASPTEVVGTFGMKTTAGFSYTKAVDGATCPLTGTGAKTDGVITGGLKIKSGNPETLEPTAFGIE